jgi:hypothetical protein
MEFIKWSGLTFRVAMTAEEVRVNRIVSVKGYDLDLLTDGSEKTSGVRIAKEALTSVDAKNELFAFGGGLVGTKAFRAYINGVRSVNKEFAEQLRKMELAILKVIRRAPASSLASTHIVNAGNCEIESGVKNYTLPIGLEIMKYQEFIDKEKIAEDVVGAGGTTYSVGSTVGKFAPLIIDKTFLCEEQVKGHLARKKRASAMGTRIAYPERLLTDPERRIFSNKAKASGGIIVIDVSGSMEISENDIDTILTLSPGALVMAYSHKPKSLGVPNAWILANRGKRCSAEQLHTIGNIGNGVDGPVLDYAVKNRRGKEPIIWLCDGQVTDAHDKSAPELTEACAKIVKRHGIIVAPTMSDVIEAMRLGRSATSKPKGRLATAMGKVR